MRSGNHVWVGHASGPHHMSTVIWQVHHHHERQRGEERLAQQAVSEQQLTEQFERLTQRIYAEETAKFKALNRDSLELLLNPLQ